MFVVMLKGMVSLVWSFDIAGEAGTVSAKTARAAWVFARMAIARAGSETARVRQSGLFVRLGCGEGGLARQV